MACFHVISISLISGGDHPCAHYFHYFYVPARPLIYCLAPNYVIVSQLVSYCSTLNYLMVVQSVDWSFSYKPCDIWVTARPLIIRSFNMF